MGGGEIKRERWERRVLILQISIGGARERLTPLISIRVRVFASGFIESVTRNRKGIVVTI